MTSGTYTLRDHILGAYFGSAAGDALGGPVEGWHAGMIKAAHGSVNHFLPYTRPLHPGYALSAIPGAITDDTFIKDDFAAFCLAYPQAADRQPMTLVNWMLGNAHFEHWWPPAVAVLKQIEAREVTLEASGKILMGGGAAWWTPFGLVHAGKPQAAYDETYRLSLVWRQSFERNLIAAVQAGVAASVMPGATVESVCDTVLEYAGLLARKLLTRAQRIACDHDGDWDGFVQTVYVEALVEQCSAEVDGPLPVSAVANDPYRGATILWAEQIALAFAAFIWGKGDFVKTLAACINLGRDCDSTGSTCGSWIGGLVGLQSMPVDWVDALQNVNIPYMNILKRASDVAGMAGA